MDRGRFVQSYLPFPGSVAISLLNFALALLDFDFTSKKVEETPHSICSPFAAVVSEEATQPSREGFAHCSLLLSLKRPRYRQEKSSLTEQQSVIMDGLYDEIEVLPAIVRVRTVRLAISHLRLTRYSRRWGELETTSPPRTSSPKRSSRSCPQKT